MTEHKVNVLEDIANRIRIWSVKMTEASKSGHTTSSTSIADILAVLFFDSTGMHYNPKNPKNLLNDKVVLSKGHACPALYAAWAETWFLAKEELLKLRKLDSYLEGHPTFRNPFIDVATGSLGQGICMAAGMAYSAKYFEKRNIKIFCILGDGEMSEGSVWEAIQFAHFYKLNNFITIVDVNKLGQSQNTPYKHEMEFIEGRFKSFGASTKIIDGHNIVQIIEALKIARRERKTHSNTCKNYKRKESHRRSRR